MDEKIMYRNKSIDELSADELRKVVRFLYGRLYELQTPENIHARALGRAKMIKRGEI